METSTVVVTAIYFLIFVGIFNFFRNAIKEHDERVKINRQQMKDSHKDYLMSDLWTQRKNTYFSKYGRFCAVCRSPFNVDLHHKSYNRVRAELDLDLIPLCRNHHDLFHKTGRHVRETDEWVKEQQRHYVQWE